MGLDVPMRITEHLLLHSRMQMNALRERERLLRDLPGLVERLQQLPWQV